MAYQKQTFKDNETVLKAEHLNHIEDGIVALENAMNDSKGVFIPNGAKVGQIIQVSAVDEIGQPTEWEATDWEIDQFSNSYDDLDFKPSINGVTLSGNKTSADLGIGDPTDEQVASAVETWLDAHPEATTTVADGSLEYNKLKNTMVFKDYFDASTVTGGYINNGIYTAQATDNLGTAYYKSSDYIEWMGDVTHFTIRTVYVAVRGVHFYDANKTFLSEATLTQTGTFKKALFYVAEVPENAKYMRFDTTEPGGDTWADGIVVWPDSTIPTDITERYLIDERVDVSRNVRALDGGGIMDKTVSGEKLKDQSIGVRKIVEVCPESIIGCDFVNLFNKNLYDLAGGVTTFYIRGAWLNTDGSIGAGGDMGGALQSWVTLFIPCYPNKTYSLYRLSDTGEVMTDWFGPRVAFWDDAGENPVGVISEDLTTFTTPDGAYYICVTLAVNDKANQQKYINRIMLVEGSEIVSSYYPYAVSPYWVNTNKTLLGTSVICYGDSLTQGKYPSKVEDILGVPVTDAGVGGNTCASIAARVGNYGTDYDVVTLMVGTNDNGGQTSCPLGTADDEAATDDNASAAETTYASRLKRLLNKIKATHRGATFVIMPPFEHAWSSYEGLAALMEEIARQYKMPFLDIYHLCGWDGTDEEDKAIFMADGTHENDVGAQRIAELLAGFIKQLKGA